MSELSITFGANEVLTHANLNQVLQELEGFTRAVSAGQLLGGITLDKLADNAAWSAMFVPVLPMRAAYVTTEGAASADVANDLSGGSADVGFVIPAAWENMVPVIQPIVKAGWECDLVGYVVHCLAYDEGADTDEPQIRVRRNGTITVGSAEITLDTNDHIWLVANSDAVANPASPFADGDYLEIQMQGATGTPRPRGVGVTLVFKHTLVSG